ncbi:MAG: carboxypeptidase M32, partial [Betaproteobacteria bacterium]
MTLATTPAYDDLVALNQRLHHLGHLGSIAGWDQAANMPPKGNEARAAALAELHGLMHRMRTDAALRDRIT